jgi:6-phosphogluconate dehydrogenase
LVSIGAQICQQRGRDENHVLAKIKDKVVQDADESEGTGIWTQDEAVNNHIPTPTMTMAHFFRLASANRAQRDKINQLMGTIKKQEILTYDSQREKFMEDLRLATYTACLASYLQGILLLEKANRVHHWGIRFPKVIQIWRAGCIVQSDYIADLLEPLLESNQAENILYEKKVIDELKRGFPALKNVVLKATETDLNIPALSATLEWIKCIGRKEMPTQFMEAELDLFGAHSFDLKSEDAEGIKKGNISTIVELISRFSSL